MRFLPKLLRRTIRNGRLTLKNRTGETAAAGGEGPGPEVILRLDDPSYDWKIPLNPELKFAEAYMDGALNFEKGDVHDLVTLFFLNKRQFDLTPTQVFLNGLWRSFRRLQQHNPISRARRNAQAHYDIGNDLYRLFLDVDMQYSCGYFPTGEETLEQAQLLKKRHIAAKLALKDGQTVLDIGCGWGGMALYLAQVADVEVLGVTLAEEQLKVARARAKTLGLSHRVRFELQDYREIEQTFDRVVSVGMLEHVGAPYLPEYFLNVRDRLKPDGVALIHSITSKDPPSVTSPFIRKHIFPGGYSPSISETVASIEKAGLWTLDVEVLRVHYAHTLAHWFKRFEANRERAKEMYDERFCRMWELYLAASEACFLFGTNAVMQLQIGRERDAVPLTRDYIGDEERALATREPGAPRPIPEQVFAA